MSTRAANEFRKGFEIRTHACSNPVHNVRTKKSRSNPVVQYFFYLWVRHDNDMPLTASSGRKTNEIEKKKQERHDDDGKKLTVCGRVGILLM